MAQGQQPPAPAPQPPATPRGRAPIDLTGYWVSIVNEDWRWRMVTPPKGDLASVPLNPEGTKVANAWDPATDGSCLAYGAAGLMRMPTRLNITWQDDRTIKIDTDAGQQTRLLRFDGGAPPAQRSLQGYSVAQWEPVPQPGRGGGAPQIPRFGNLKVTTTQSHGGLAAQERRALQRERHRHGVLRPLQGAEQRRVARRDDDRVRFEVSEPGLRHEHALQEGAERRQVESGSVQAGVGGSEDPPLRT